LPDTKRFALCYNLMTNLGATAINRGVRLLSAQ